MKPAKPADANPRKKLIRFCGLLILGVGLTAIGLFGDKKTAVQPEVFQLTPDSQDFRFSKAGHLQIQLDQKKFSPWIDTQVPNLKNGYCSRYRIDGQGVEIQFWDGARVVDSGKDKIWLGIRKGIFRIKGTGTATVTVEVSRS